jgi:hypothetical protein
MENDVTYPDPYSRPAPDRFSRRWLVITGCIAALMLLGFGEQWNSKRT